MLKSAANADWMKQEPCAIISLQQQPGPSLDGRGVLIWCSSSHSSYRVAHQDSCHSLHLNVHLLQYCCSSIVCSILQVQSTHHCMQYISTLGHYRRLYAEHFITISPPFNAYKHRQCSAWFISSPYNSIHIVESLFRFPAWCCPRPSTWHCSLSSLPI